MNKKKIKDNSKNTASTSRAATPTFANDPAKRKANSMPSDLTGSENSNSPMSTPAKRAKVDTTPSLPSTFAGVVNANNKECVTQRNQLITKFINFYF